MEELKMEIGGKTEIPEIKPTFIPLPVYPTNIVNKFWNDKYLKYKLYKHQYEVYEKMLDKDIHYMYVDWTRRGGKSFTLAVCCIEAALKEKVKIRYATAYLSDLIEFIIPAFEKALEDCPGHVKPKWKENKKTFVFPNGSEIKLLGVDKNPNGLRGTGIGMMVLDEGAFIKNLKYIYESVISPATAGQKVKIVIISTPPESPTHYSSVLKTKAKEHVKGFYTKLTLDQVEMYSDEEKERLINEIPGGRESTTVKREYFCEWIADTDRAVCPQFKEDIHVQDVALPDHFYAWISGDTGSARDKTVFHLMFYDYKTNKTIIYDEMAYEHRMSPTEMLEGLKYWKEIYKKHIKAVWLDMPELNRLHWSELGVSSAKPLNWQSKQSDNLAFIRNEFYLNKVLVSPRCKLLIKTLTSGMLNRQRSDFERTPELGHCDALMSAVYGLYSKIIQDPYPERTGNNFFKIAEEKQKYKNLKKLVRR